MKSQAQWTRWFVLAGADAPGSWRPGFWRPGSWRPGSWRRVLFDRSHMAIDAAAAGMGIALESTPTTERETACGALVRPVRDAPEIRLVTQWIVCPRDHLRQRKVRLFLDWLRAERDVWQARQAAAG